MALTRDEKQAILTDLTEKFQRSKSLMFAQYKGLSVAEISELRSKLRDAGSEMKVAKKTLMRLAAKKANCPEFDPVALEGPIGCILSFDDPFIGAQVAFRFGKNHPKVTLVGGIFEGKVLSKGETLTLATLPSRIQMLMIFAAMLRSPLVHFATACNSPLAGFTRGVKELAQKKASS